MEEDSKKIILDIFECGSTIFSKHARERMKERNYSFRDVRHIIRHGTIAPSRESQDRYFCSGNDLEGHPGEVVIEIRVKSKKIIIITVQGGVS